MVSALVDELDDQVEGEAGMFGIALGSSMWVKNEPCCINSGSIAMVTSRSLFDRQQTGCYRLSVNQHHQILEVVNDHDRRL